MVALRALPVSAAEEPLELHRSLHSTPELPDNLVFEELLFSFADPGRALEGGFSVPSLSLAVRARAWAFVRPGMRGQRDALDVLSLSAQDVTLSDLPAGGHLASLLDLGPEVEQLRVRDLGPWLSGPHSPLQALHPMLNAIPGQEKTAVLIAGVAGLGLAYQFGSLGLSPSMRSTLLGGRLQTSFRLQTEPHFQNARADVSARFFLPETLRLPLLGGHGYIEQLELGGTAARSVQGILIDERWARLRGRLSWLELSLGVHSSHAEPPLWMDLETSVRRESFCLRAVFSRQWMTTRTLATATATLRTGSVLSGLFIGIQGNARSTFGLVGMGSF